MTMYSSVDYMLVPNAINRFAIGDRTSGLQYDPDGGLTILIQHRQPQAGQQANWLPAPPDEFYLTFRAYQPREEFLSGRYRLPPVDAIE